jgi:hypothetical protein
MNLTNGPAAQCFPGPIKFDGKRRRVGVPMIFAQWQKGVPTTVFPTNLALATPAIGLTDSKSPLTGWPPRAKEERKKKSDPRDESYLPSVRIRIEGRDNLLGLFRHSSSVLNQRFV